MPGEGSFSGSTFFCIGEASPVIAAGGAQITEVPAARETDRIVLVFSPEPDSRCLFKTLLEFWGYKALECDRPERLLTNGRDRRPSLILLDCILPFAANLEIIRRLRRDDLTGKVPIVVLSGFSQPQFRTLSLAAGADLFLVKPLDFDLLEDQLRINIDRTL